MSALKDIIIVYPQKETARAIRSLVEKNGFHISHICQHAYAALEQTYYSDGQGIIICPFFMRDMSAAELAQQLPVGFDVIALSKSGMLQFADNLVSLPVPIDTDEFIQTLSSLYSSKSGMTKREQDESSCISSAKQAIMAANGFSEMQAHKYLQKESMKSGKKLSDVASQILETLGG